MCKNVVHSTHYSSFFCSCSLMHVHTHKHACIRTLLCLVHFPLAPLEITPTSLCFFGVFTKTNNELSSDTVIPFKRGFLCFLLKDQQFFWLYVQKLPKTTKKQSKTIQQNILCMASFCYCFSFLLQEQLNLPDLSTLWSGTCIQLCHTLCA